MILADTSVWVDHLRAEVPRLAALLGAARVLCHPLVVAEIGLGTLRDRTGLLALLDGLPMAPEARTPEVRRLIEARRLYGRGVGYVDAALLAACLLAPGAPRLDARPPARRGRGRARPRRRRDGLTRRQS